MKRTGLACFQAIDVIIGCLCRGGPAETRTFALLQREVATRINGVASFLLGRRCHERLGSLEYYDLGTLVVPHALKYLRGWLEVLLDFDNKVVSLISPDDVEVVWKRLLDWSVEDFVPNAKFLVVDPMARFLHQERPERPASLSGSSYLFTGRLKRFIKARMHSCTLKNASLFQGILQGVKRACEVVPDSFIHKALLKHRERLSTVPSISWDMNTRFERKCRILFRHFFSDLALYEASPSASKEYVRSKGGQRQFILDTVEGKSSEFLRKMVEVSPGVVEEARSSYDISNTSDVLAFLRYGGGEMKALGPLQEYWSELIMQNPFRRPLEVQVSAVLEPLKVRLITKGESLPYWFSKFYQKDLHSYLRKKIPFSLIGEPLDTKHLDWLRTQTIGLNIPFEFWVSGDYSAATDGLKLPYTKTAFEASLDRVDLPHYQKEVLRSVLYEQEISYPPKSGVEKVSQRTGQLMGSPLSFPILCVVNLIGYWLSMEEYLGRTLRFDELAVLVNGDDILFGSNKDHYKIWLRWIEELGFSLSLGKNYCHPRFLTVNSELYLDRGHDFKHVPYLNVGLMTGQSKLTGRASDRMLPLWALHNLVVKGAMNPLRANKRFIHYNRPLVEKLTNYGEFSLYSHWCLGGLGFMIPRGLEPRFTAFQRRLAIYLKNYCLQPVAGREISTRHFWKGIVTRNVRTSEPQKLLYKEVVPFKGEGPLQKGVELFYESEDMNDPMTFEYDLEKPVFEVRLLPRNILRGFRSTKPCSLWSRFRASELGEFPYRFVSIEKSSKSIRGQWGF